MNNNILNSQSLADVCTAVKQDLRDTMDKITSIFPDLCEILNPSLEIGETFKPELSVIQSGGEYQLLMNDGDVITLQFSDHNIYAVINETEYIPIFSYDMDEKTLTLITDSIPAINGDLWSFEEILSSLSTTYTVKDVLDRAIQLIIDSEFSTAAFNSKCSDILSRLSGDAALMYSNILACVSEGNVNGIISLIQGQYSSISDAEVNNNSIDFASTDYYVEGFGGTVFLSIIGSATQVLGSILIATGNILGLAISLVGSVISSITSIVATAAGAYAKVDNLSMYRLFAVPLQQANNINMESVKEVYPLVYSHLKRTGFVKWVHPSFVVFMWINPDLEHAAMEVFLNCTIDPTKLHSYNVMCRSFVHSGESEKKVEISNQGLTWNSEFTDVTIINSMSKYPAILNLSDEQARELVSSSLVAFSMYCGLAGIGFNSSTDPNSLEQYFWNNDGLYWRILPYPPTPYWYNDGSNYAVIQNAINILDKWYNSNNAPVYPSWEDITNTIIPAFRSQDYSHEIMCILEVLERKNQGYILVLEEVSSKGDFWITPPSVTVNALVWAGICSIAVAVATTATFAIARYKLSARVDRSLTKRRTVVNQLKDVYINDPTEANWRAYYRKARGYNIIAKIFGRSSINIVSGYDQLSVENDLQSNNTIETLNSLNDATSRDIKEVVELIKR